MSERSFMEQTLLITGGTGSFGQHLAERVLKDGLFKKVIIFSRDEWKQSQMRERDPIFTHPKIRYFLGDVRDKERLQRAFQGVDVVIHAAALKQVPVAEYNPSEFVKTNILGAMNVVDAAIDQGVKLSLALSTDKAVGPNNLYGATKLCQDRIFIASNAYVGQRGYPLFAVTRYGNVAGTRGSVIPIWEKMIRDGVSSLPITDVRMTRFWITLDEAVNFVLKSLKRMQGGEIFVPKLPSVRLTDLKEAIAPHIKTEYVGLREGEKLHESLISEDEAHHTMEEKDCYTVLPIKAFRDSLPAYDKSQPPLPAGFAYRSDTNPDFLTTEQLKKFFSK